MSYVWTEECGGCGKPFVNSSGCTALECPACQDKNRTEDPIDKAYAMFEQGWTIPIVVRDTGLSYEIATAVSDLQLRGWTPSEIKLELAEEL